VSEHGCVALATARQKISRPSLYPPTCPLRPSTRGHRSKRVTNQGTTPSCVRMSTMSRADTQSTRCAGRACCPFSGLTFPRWGMRLLALTGFRVGERWSFAASGGEAVAGVVRLGHRGSFVCLSSVRMRARFGRWAQPRGGAMGLARAVLVTLCVAVGLALPATAAQAPSIHCGAQPPT
jgi:hypothetical protein